MKFSLLIVDDDKIVCNSLKRILEKNDYEISVLHSAEDALDYIETQKSDLFILDYKLPGIDGLKLLKLIKEKYPDALIIILTAYGNVSLAVEAMRNGAYDFLEKESDPDLVRFTVQKALDNIRLKKEIQTLRDEFINEKNINNIISESEDMKNVISLADQFAQTDTTVLLTGETGTGKSLIAEHIHCKSKRFNQKYLTVNCGAIPKELIESELFGYEKGAFTGAHTKGKIGLIKKADGGTVFLDEIGELPLDIQSKLLQVLEKSEFFKVGGVDPVKINVRFIAATNANLQELIQNNRFRSDLYYRINVAHLYLPPLRARKADILLLCKFYIDRFNSKFNKNVNKISQTAQRIFESYRWPGNIRELRNIIERIMILKKDSVIDESDICHLTNQIGELVTESANLPICLNFGDGNNQLHEVQKTVIEHALKYANGNKSKAAKLLGVPRTSLQFYIDKFEIKKEQ